MSSCLRARGWTLDGAEITYSNLISDFNNSCFQTPINYSAAAIGVETLAPLG